MKNKFCLLTLSVVVALTSCQKKEDAASKIKPTTEDIAPASPEVQAAPATPQTTPTEAQTAPQQQATAKPNPNATEMTFAEKEFDFGKIKQGDKVSHTFTFKNTGANDLVITNAVGSCGCTVPEYPKEAIKPGKTGKMKVTFDSTGKSGDQKKTVTITANTAAGMETISIKAKVDAPAAANVTPVSSVNVTKS